jgi:transketolase
LFEEAYKKCSLINPVFKEGYKEPMNITELCHKAQAIKVRYAELCVEKQKGHLSSGLSCAEIVTVLYYSILCIDPHRPDWVGRDKFIMSKNHGIGIVYPILRDLGYFDESMLASYQDNGSYMGTHSKIIVPGIDFSGGSLGIGLGVACGYALAARAENNNWLTFCLLGDCECQEGSVWESVMFAGHSKLNNLIAIIDANGEGCSDYMENLIELRPFRQKFEAFGWEVLEVVDGHNIADLLSTFQNVRLRKSDKPLCIVANTIKGNGMPTVFKNKPWLHSHTPTGDEGKLAIEELKSNIEKGV